jgi:hypothetical protein
MTDNKRDEKAMQEKEYKCKNGIRKGRMGMKKIYKKFMHHYAHIRK